MNPGIPMPATHRLFWLLLLMLTLLGGCASMPLDDVRRDFLQGKPQAAIAVLDEQDSRRDKLLIHMEKGLILHSLGEYEESAQEFLKAEKLMEELDVISVSEQAKTLVVNEWAAAYKGEYSERLWVHTYQMMNYLLLGNYQSAAVEARQALDVIKTWGDPLQKDWFTQALIGLSFEGVGKYNDAFIEYRKLVEKLSDEEAVTALAPMLYWAALRSSLAAEAAEYRERLPDSLKETDPDELGELVLFVARGAIPQKVPGDVLIAPDIRFSFPHYPETLTLRPRFAIESVGGPVPVMEVSTLMGEVARDSLSARAKKIYTKETARVAFKQSLAHNLKKNNEAAGELLGILFLLMEEADTREWSTLPATLSLLRIPLKPGNHSISLLAAEDYGNMREIFSIEDFDIKAGQRIYRKIRY